jgi:hypothetical protein
MNLLRIIRAVFMSATVAVMSSASAHAEEYRFDWVPEANLQTTAAGKMTYFKGTFNTVTKQLLWAVTIEPSNGSFANGMHFTLSNTLGAKGPGHVATFFFDATDPTKPKLTVYAFNGSDASTSWKTGNGTAGADRIISSLTSPSWIKELSVKDEFGRRTFRMVVDATPIINHKPLYNPGSYPWYGTGFGDRIGLKIFPVSGLSTAYDTSGFLTKFNFGCESKVDGLCLETTKVVTDCAGVPNGSSKVDACGVCGGNGLSCAGCDGVPNSGKKIDQCGVCGGNNLSCAGCDGVPNSGKKIDRCGVCGGNSTSCAGCDGVPNSGKTYDSCGVCGGNGLSCNPPGCDGVPNSGKTVDQCGVCGGNGSSCKGCDGVPNSGKTVDQCGVCGGDGSSCVGCDGVPNSGKTVDQCGVCGGDGTSCVGCDGVHNSGKTVDQCGVCGGDDSSCLGCDGVPNSGKTVDSCGVCGGDGASCTPNNGCDGVPNSGKTVDQCGVCGGDGTACLGCDGVPNSGKTVDQCGVCGGDGTTCVGPSSDCTNKDITDVIFALDQGSNALNVAVRTAGKRLLKVAANDKAVKKFVASALKRSEQLHMDGWAGAWSFPQIVGECPLSASCTKTDLTPSIQSYLQSADQMRKIGASIVKRLRRYPAGQKSVASLSRSLERHYGEAVEVSKKLPTVSIKCG